MLFFNNIALIEGDTHFTKWVIEAGRLDHDQTMLRKLTRFLTGTVLDLGANVGTHTWYYLNHAPRVVAVEPLPEAFECLEYNCASSQNQNYRLLDCAVGSDWNLVSLIRDTANYGMAHTSEQHGDIVVIPIDALDEEPSFIKLDIEGDEFAALTGGYHTISKHKPALLIEINEGALNVKKTNAAPIFNFLKELGYVWGIEQENADPTQYDIICIHRDKL